MVTSTSSKSKSSHSKFGKTPEQALAKHALRYMKRLDVTQSIKLDLEGLCGPVEIWRRDALSRVVKYLKLPHIVKSRGESRLMLDVSCDYYKSCALPQGYYSYEEDVRDFMLDIAFHSLVVQIKASPHAYEAAKEVIAEWVRLGIIPNIIAELAPEIILNQNRPLKRGKKSGQTLGEYIRDIQLVYIIASFDGFSQILPKSKDYEDGIFRFVASACSQVADLKCIDESRVMHIFYSSILFTPREKIVHEVEAVDLQTAEATANVTLPIPSSERRKDIKVAIPKWLTRRTKR